MILPPYDREATEPEICNLLAALVSVRRPRVVVEAGTYRGHSALLMADACRRTGMGHVYTFDPVDHGIQHYIDKNDLGPWITYTRGPFETPNVIDFAFIDASAPDLTTGRMSAKLRAEHFFRVKDRIAPLGLICVHDTLHPSQPWYDGEGGESMHRIRAACNLNMDYMRGLSVFQAPR